MFFYYRVLLLRTYNLQISDLYLNSYNSEVDPHRCEMHIRFLHQPLLYVENFRFWFV